MFSVQLHLIRSISTSAPRHGKKNFRKFQLFNKRGSRLFKKNQIENPQPDLLDKRGVRDIGYVDGNKFVTIPERIPELIVPDLTGFQLKPYVSYKAPDIKQEEFTAQDLFNVVYAPKIIEDFNSGKLNEDGTPKEPSAEENMSPEVAEIRARQTGADLFCSKD
ncbi:39S ribosomal protein L41, mitochondrial [Coccinella septempunctata]|uniref:39S ribosomal protein L41, mitochondrial n=1 Tax=Coccinella septempunctata TaxID=41139 RepID=UPI001D07B24A|nr:39S ribosomal protein L41, mitochondrial [Coccinella septempunctata]